MELKSNSINDRLLESLKELLAQKKFEKIKVIDICKHSNVPRSTFYYHFNDKNELLEYGIKKTTSDITEEVMKNNPIDLEEYMGNLRNIIIDYLDENKSLYSSLIKNNQNSKSFKIMFEIIREDMKDKFNSEKENYNFPAPIDFIVEFIVGGSASVTMYWMENIDTYTTEDFKEAIDGIYPNNYLYNKIKKI